MKQVERCCGRGFDSLQVHQKENDMDDEVARFIFGVAIIVAIFSFFF